MLVEWRPEARAELWTILDYIGDRNPVAADDPYQAIEVATSALPVHPNYLVVYRVTDHIEVVSVLHARQEYP